MNNGTFFNSLAGYGVSDQTTVEVGVIGDLIEEVLRKCPHDQGLYIFAQMLGALFADEARNPSRDSYGSRSYSMVGGDQYYYSGRPGPIEVLRRKNKRDYGFGFVDKPVKQKPPVFPVDIVVTDTETLYILTNPDGSVDEYTKFTNLEKYATSKNGKITWLGDEDTRPLSLLWNEEDDPDNE